jgi:DNA-binding NtrC family response regulator
VALERGSLIQVASLPSEQGPKAPGRNGAAAAEPAALPEDGLDLPKHLEAQERELVSQALRQSGGRHDRAARLLAISPRQLRYLLDKYALR